MRTSGGVERASPLRTCLGDGRRIRDLKNENVRGDVAMVYWSFLVIFDVRV